MELLTSVICDSASDYSGKLCILGAFDTIWCGSFPTHHPHCTLALRFLFNDSDMGEHNFEVVFVNADGKQLLPKGPIQFNIRIEAIPDERYFISRNLVINMQGLQLPEAGQYAFDIKCDENVLSRIPIQAVQGMGRPPTSEGNPPPV